MSIVIRYDGTDITSDVEFRSAEFTMVVNGVPGSCSFRVKDTNHTHAFVTGREITVDVEGIRVWGGYVMHVSRQYAFDVDVTQVPTTTPRYWKIEGSDYNILLHKRLCYDHGNYAAPLLVWPTGTSDVTVVTYLLDHYTDLAADGVTHTGITAVTSPYPDQEGRTGVPGATVADALLATDQNVNALFWIDATKNFHWVDADTPTSPYVLTDHPTAPSHIGYRDFVLTNNASQMANDVMVWGAGTGSTTAAPTFSRATDISAINLHGRWQHAEFRAGIYHQDRLDQAASRLLNGTPQTHRGLKIDKTSWSATVFEPLFFAGDKVEIHSDVFGVSDVVPIRRMKITFPTNIAAKFDLTLSHELDFPWQFYEFWFPDLNIVIPEPQFENCPMPMAGGFVIFSDAFHRPTTSSPNGGHYYLTTDPTNEYHPMISAGIGAITNGNTHISLNSPTSPPWEVLVAADLNAADFTFGSGNFSLAVRKDGTLSISLSSSVYETADHSSYTTWGSVGRNGTHSAPSTTAYIRFGIGADGYCYVKVWRSELTEAYASVLDIGADTNPNNLPAGYTLIGRSNCDLLRPRLTGYLFGISIFSTGVAAPFPAVLGSQDSNGTGLAGRTMWSGHWAFTMASDTDVYFFAGGYMQPPPSGSGYRQGYTELTQEATGMPGIFYNSINKSYGVFTSSVPMMSDAYETIYGLSGTPTPTSVLISGESYANVGSSGFFAPPPIPWPMTVELAVFPTAFNSLDPSDDPPPFMSADAFLGQSIGYALTSATDWVRWEFEVPWSYFRKYLRFDVRITNKTSQGWAAPFNPPGMLAPNVNGITATTRKLLFKPKYEPSGIFYEPFCVAIQGGGTTATKVCEILTPTNATATSWTGYVASPYVGGSLEVWVDGMTLEQGNYQQTNGTMWFTVYGDLRNVEYVRVCYWPQSDTQTTDSHGVLI